MKRAAASIALVVALAGCDWLPPPPPPSAAATAGSGGSGGSAETSSGTGSTSSSGTGGSALVCPVCEPVEQTGTLASLEEIEISGIVASIAHEGVFYVHNDSGDEPRFFAIDEAGAALATFTVAGAKAVDWEDLARGPCPTGTCLYLGDIGDNNGVRNDCAVYRVAEPATIASTMLAAEKLAFTYPDGPHNAETLLADPATGGLFIVTKTLGVSSVYAFPLPLTPGKSVVLKKGGDLSLPIMPALITGGDVHPGGRGVLLRTYSDVWLFPQSKGMSVVDALLGTPCAEPSPIESQAEAIGWLASGAGYVTTSEGASAPISRVKCAIP